MLELAEVTTTTIIAYELDWNYIITHTQVPIIESKYFIQVIVPAPAEYYDQPDYPLLQW